MSYIKSSSSCQCATRTARKAHSPRREAGKVAVRASGVHLPIAGAIVNETPGFRPLYRQVYDIVVRRVAQGVWRPGEALPSEQNLARELGVSQGTIRKVFDALTAEKVLERHQGKGTFIAENTQERAQFRFFRLARPGGKRLAPPSAARPFGCVPRAHRSASASGWSASASGWSHPDQCRPRRRARRNRRDRRAARGPPGRRRPRRLRERAPERGVRRGLAGAAQPAADPAHCRRQGGVQRPLSQVVALAVRDVLASH